ncbi:lmo0937 family membrane protein [Aneurinibacillus sp. BA2021]|nr:lmo0937 family membrane protein [Aneurinibacillus sp. BA2021]
MLWTIIGLLLLFWVFGLIFHITGGIIHLVLIVAAVMFIIKLVSGRSRDKT